MGCLPNVFFGCFSNHSSKIVCEEQVVKCDKIAQKRGDSKVVKRSSAPIPVSYFPIGARFSRL
ncbi:hypothetical protein vseg_011545 [Gypsophila vaccaria]